MGRTRTPGRSPGNRTSLFVVVLRERSLCRCCLKRMHRGVRPASRSLLRDLRNLSGAISDQEHGCNAKESSVGMMRFEVEDTVD